MMPRPPKATTRAIGALAAWLLFGLLACEPAQHKVGVLRSPGQSAPARAGSQAQGRAGAGPDDAGPTSTGGSGTGAILPTSGRGSSSSAGESAPPMQSTGGISGSICFPTTMPAERKRLDLYLMVDVNITLPLSGAWGTVTNGLMEYVDDDRARGTGVGIDFFGVLPPVTMIDCSPDLYSMPTVPVGVLPGNTSAIQTSVRRAIPLQGSPLQPALEGALAYSRSRAGFYDDEAQQAVVLITDGFVDLSCGTDVREVSNAAATEMKRSPPVPTYVVALDVPSLSGLFDPLVRFEPLEAIAREGGTGLARRLDVEDPSSEVVDVLLDVQHDAEPCDYFVPDEAMTAGSTVTLSVSSPGAATVEPMILKRFGSVDECGDGYYMLEDSEQVALCPVTCDSVKARGQTLAWTIDCGTP